MTRPGRDLLLLALGILPPLLLGVAWMRQTGVPAAVYGQNVAAAIAGAAIAGFTFRRRVSPAAGLAVTALALVLLLATLAAEGVQGVHRWIRIGPLSLHVASLVLPLVLVELDRLLRHARLAIALGVMLVATAILAMQPDASQATAFAGAGIVLLAIHRQRKGAAIAGMLALLTIAGLSFLRSDPLAPVPHVEEIAVRIAEQGLVWKAAVLIALALLIVPFAASASASLAVAVYLTLVIAASWWGNFPVPVMGYGMSPIIGYFAGWTWLWATRD
jgi:cell division protein FtsW (lipid II flippase)